MIIYKFFQYLLLVCFCSNIEIYANDTKVVNDKIITKHNINNTSVTSSKKNSTNQKKKTSKKTIKSKKKTSQVKKYTKKNNKRTFFPTLRSSILVDFEKEQIVEAYNPYKRIYPASLTKLMTLYILFSELKQQNLHLNTLIKISTKASRVAASKLYLKPGDKIKTKEAIHALIIKSANDVAISVAEKISGTEELFVKKMNYVAQKLNMFSTYFVNSSGLHHDKQFSTSSDIAKLIIALKKDFPEYVKFLECNSFHFRGKLLTTKNNLPIFQYPGVKWLKSGYTHKAGRNLIVDASIKNREVIAVTVGNRSHEERNINIKQLLNTYKLLHEY